MDAVGDVLRFERWMWFQRKVAIAPQGLGELHPSTFELDGLTLTQAAHGTPQQPGPILANLPTDRKKHAGDGSPDGRPVLKCPGTEYSYSIEEYEAGSGRISSAG